MLSLPEWAIARIALFIGGKPWQIIEAALTASAEAIISGDSHLLALKTFRGILIYTLAECLEKYKLG